MGETHKRRVVCPHYRIGAHDIPRCRAAVGRERRLCWCDIHQPTHCLRFWRERALRVEASVRVMVAAGVEP